MPIKKLTSKLAPDAHHVHSLKETCLNSSGPKLSEPIDKNSVIAEYDASCVKRGIKDIVSTAKKGEPTTIPITYPTIAQLVRDCSMKPSLNHQYRVSDLCLDNVIVELIKSPESFLTIEDVSNLSQLNSMYSEMITDVIDLRTMVFSEMKLPRLGYAKQTAIDPIRVKMATACAIHYSLHPGMVIRYLKGEYVGENRDVNRSYVTSHLSLMKLILLISNESWPKDVHRGSISTRLRPWKLPLLKKATKQPLNCTQKPSQRPWTRKTGIVIYSLWSFGFFIFHRGVVIQLKACKSSLARIPEWYSMLQQRAILTRLF